MNKLARVALVAWIGSLVLQSAAVSQPGQVAVNAPLAGLLPSEFSEFRMGLDDFLEVETAEEGLGPAFNGTSSGAAAFSNETYTTSTVPSSIDRRA